MSCYEKLRVLDLFSGIGGWRREACRPAQVSRQCRRAAYPVADREHDTGEL
jgi:hypothetical protein